jgi:hypothetical protein
MATAEMKEHEASPRTAFLVGLVGAIAGYVLDGGEVLRIPTALWAAWLAVFVYFMGFNDRGPDGLEEAPLAKGALRLAHLLTLSSFFGLGGCAVFAVAGSVWDRL